MDLKIIKTPDVQAGIELLQDCAAAGAIGVITGPNGTGKTEALRAIEKTYGKLGLQGIALYYRCHFNKRSTRGIKDLLDCLGVRQAAFQSGASVQFSVKTCMAELKKRKIHCLLIDEADLWTKESLIGLIGLFDMAQLEQFHLTILLGSTGNPDLWLSQITSARSRTLKVVAFGYLTRDLMLEVLRHWGEGFEKLANQVSKRQAEAKKIAGRIHKLTGGNFRRLGHYGRLHLTYFKNQTPNAENLELVSAKMTNE